MVGAVDLGGTKTIVGLVDAQGKVTASEQFATNTADCAAHLAEAVQRLRGLAGKLGLSLSQLDGVGAALPGVVDAARTQLVQSAYPDWNGRPIARMLAELCENKRVAVENDVNACALAELHFGYGAQFSDFLWVTVSTGVGGAVVCGGELMRGSRGFSGEIGHLKVERDAPLPCPSCGGAGCLEAHGSGRALGALFSEQAVREPLLAKKLEHLGLLPDAKSCTLLAGQGDVWALACCEQVGCYLGRGLAAAVNLLDPQALILGGGVSGALPLLRPFILRAMQEETHPKLWPVALLQTKLGYQAALVGAAALVVS